MISCGIWNAFLEKSEKHLRSQLLISILIIIIMIACRTDSSSSIQQQKKRDLSENRIKSRGPQTPQIRVFSGTLDGFLTDEQRNINYTAKLLPKDRFPCDSGSEEVNICRREKISSSDPGDDDDGCCWTNLMTFNLWRIGQRLNH